MNQRYFSIGLSGLAAGLLLSAPGEVVAQSASAAAMLEEVVVTARRREESLQDLPLSISAISADAMQAQGIYNIADIGESVPNLTFTTTDRRHVKAVFIRGIGGSRPITLAPVGTGLYLDGHYMPNTVGQMMSTVDVERVEVLRGPQGTLFGKNTTGGAINIITTKPQPEFEADVIMRVADYGQQDLRGMLNIPLSDTVFTRFSVAKETTDGYFYSRTLNEDRGGTDLNAYAAALRWVPNDNWTVDVGFRGNKQDDQDLGGQCRVAPTQGYFDTMDAQYGVNGLNDPGWAANRSQWQAAVVSNGVGGWGGANLNAEFGDVGHIERIYTGATLDFWEDCTTDNASGDFVMSQEKDTFLDLNNEWFNSTIQYDSGGEMGVFDNVNVKLIMSTQNIKLDYLQDRDMSSLSIDGIGRTPPGNTRETENFELIFTLDVNDRMSVIAGINDFYDEVRSGKRSPTGCLALFEQNLATFQAEVDSGQTLPGLSVPCVPDGGGLFDRLGNAQILGGPATSGRDGYEINDTTGIFAHMTYDLNDDWTLAVGGRQTSEDRIFHQLEFNSVTGTCLYDDPNNPNNPRSIPGAPPPTGICRPDFALTRDAFTGGFYNNAQASFDEFTPMMSFTRQLEGGDTLDSGSVYFSYSQGFLAGSFNDELNVVREPALAPLVAYGPETVDSYEVGFKGTFQDGQTTLRTALFYMDYQDMQQSVNIDNADGRFGPDSQIEVTSNAANAKIQGFEVELRTQPWDGGFLMVDLAYLDNEFSDYSSFDIVTGGTDDLSGLTIADFSPDWTLNMMVEHQFELANGATITPQLGMYYQSEYDFQGGLLPGERSVCFQDGYTKLRARVTYEPANADWQASLFGSNIGDERYLQICGTARSGVFDYRYGAPSIWGLEFNYRWGS